MAVELDDRRVPDGLPRKRTEHSAPQPAMSRAAPEKRVGSLSIGEIADALYNSRWIIAACIVAAAILGAAHVYIATPIYQADSLMQLEENRQSLTALTDIAEFFERQSPVTGEIEILRSRLVLGQVVDNLKLDLAVAPVHAPIIGAAVSRRHEGPGVAEAKWGLEDYAWGGEKITIDTVTVPQRWLGRPLILEALHQGRFRLLGPNEELLGMGAVGVTTAFRSSVGEISLLVSELEARPNTSFYIIKKHRESAISELREDLVVREAGERSKLLQLQLSGSSQNGVSTTLNEITEVYLNQNVGRASAETQQTLEFLEKRLPLVKEEMELAERSLNSFRLDRGSVDLTKETQVILDQMVEVQAQLSRLRGERQELIQRYTPQHPLVATVDAQIARLENEANRLEETVRTLPSTQQEILRLTRDVAVTTELYTLMLNRAQEIRVLDAGTVGSVRVVDKAVAPPNPVKPKKQLVLILYMIAGTIIATAIALTRKMLFGGVEDPEDIERELRLPVYAVIPHSRGETRRSARKVRKQVLAMADPADSAVEALRSLRTSLHFAMLGTNAKLVMITGPLPGVGKTFVSTNLAAVLAAGGERVLLIDGDLRRGCVHRQYGMTRLNGLSDAIVGSVELNRAIRDTDIAGLHVLPAGTPPPNPGELLLSDQFPNLLNQVRRHYTYVLVDTPPILTVADALSIGRHCNGTLLVIKAGKHSIREIDVCATRLARSEASVSGIIMNDVLSIKTRFGYGRYYVYSGKGYQDHVTANPDSKPHHGAPT